MGVGLGVDVFESVAFELALAVAVPESEDFADIVDVKLGLEDTEANADREGRLDLDAEEVAIADSVGKALIVASCDELALADGVADPVAVAEEEGKRHPQTIDGKFAANTAND